MRVLWIVAALWLVACASSGNSGADRQARLLVQSSATGVFKSRFRGPADRAALRWFLGATESARTREDLLRIWSSHPDLGTDFDGTLADIFQRAIEDPKWPQGGSLDQHSVFVVGTRQAANSILARPGLG